MPRVAAPRTPAKPPLPLRARRPSRLSLLWRRKRGLVLAAVGLLVLVAAAIPAAKLVHLTRPGNSVVTMRERVGDAVGLVVKEVRVDGREKTPETKLRAAIGISPGDKMFGFSLDAVRARIESLTWVQHATVERRLPGTIVVTLEERRPFAVWQNGGKFQLIDRAGQVVVEQDPVKDAAAFATLPLVVGPGAPENAAVLLDLLAAQPTLKSRVTAAVRVGERRWNLRLSNGADVLLPEGAEAAAMARLMELNAQYALLDRPLQVLDMRLPDRLVIRPVTDPHAPTPPPRRPA